MPDILLVPSGRLRWLPDSHSPDPEIECGFEHDWREGLFLLAARRPGLAAWPALRYWQAFAERYLTALCHLPPDTAPDVAAPTPTDGEQWLAAAPPLPGGEYLSAAMLLQLWRALDEWACQACTAEGGLQPFLAAHAPQWRQVGRVWLHLAENRQDPQRPFAFMATYTDGLGETGQVRHLPLGKALEYYAGARNRAALLRLLTPVQQASTRLTWLRELVDGGELYQPRTWPAARAYRLLADLPVLEESGLAVRVPDWWKARPRPAVQLTVERRGALGLDAMLEFDVGVALGGQALSEPEIQDLLQAGDGLVSFKGRWVEIDRERLQQVLRH